MVESNFLVIFGGFTLLIIVSAVLAARAAAKRKEEFLALSRFLGFNYYPAGLDNPPTKGFFSYIQQALSISENTRFLQRFEGFSPFGLGSSPRLQNLICGNRDGIDWYLFDYSYQTQSGTGENQSTTTHSYGIVAARVPLSLPRLTLTPENMFHRIGSKLGVQDLTFELEEFNRRYFIQSQDPKRAHDLLHPKAIEYLMGKPVRHWQMAGTYVLISQSGTLRPQQFHEMLSEMEGFLQLVPDYVRQDIGFPVKWESPLH